MLRDLRTYLLAAALLALAACLIPGPGKAAVASRAAVVHRLDAGLTGTPLSGLGAVFERQGWQWNVNPFLVAAISGTESSFGAARCGWNVFGWNACHGDTFTSFESGIRTVTRALRVWYLDRWRLYTVDRIGAVYCGSTCGSSWAVDTSWFMRHRFGSSLIVVYPG